MTRHIIAHCRTAVKPPRTDEPNGMVEDQLRGILAGWLQAGMDRLGLNPTELARQTGVSRDTIYRMLGKDTRASDETVRDLATVIGPPPDLIGQSRTAEKGPSSPGEPSKPGGPSPVRGPGRRTADQEAARKAVELEAAKMQRDAARLEVLAERFRAYRRAGKTPSPDILGEWEEIARANSLDEVPELGSPASPPPGPEAGHGPA